MVGLSDRNDPLRGRARDPFGAATKREMLDRRRPLTMMSIDLVGSTPLAERLDPELLRNVIVAYHDVCDQAIARYDGRIGNRAGDGILAHFGVENPHETDARRAALTGLAILDGLAPLAARMLDDHDVAIEVRIGVHTGPVVITNINGRDELVGPAANETARIQSTATPNIVAISEQTLDLVRHEFHVTNGREVALKGVGKSILIHDIVAHAGNVAPPASIGPFVGRTEEAEQLDALWNRLEAGDAVKPALVIGAGGIGKSRLCETFLRQCQRRGARRFVARTQDHDADVRFHPFAALLRETLGIAPELPAESQFEQLLAGTAHLPVSPAPGLSQVLGLGHEWLGDLAGAEPAAMHSAVVQALLVWLRGFASTGPAVLLVEDLHWADPSTVIVLGELVARPEPNLLVVYTCRPGMEPAWDPTRIELVNVAPLSSLELHQMADSLFANPLTNEDRSRLVENSDGVPLYLTQLADETRRRGRPWDGAIPNGLDQLLTARIEAPDVDRVLVGSLAVIGREFSIEFAAEVLDIPDLDLRQRLVLLSKQGLVDADVRRGNPRFVFRHALVQATAYSHLLSSDRARVHAQIAEVLTQRGHDDLDSATIARHYDLGGRPLQAAEQYLAASKAAHRAGATTEAERLTNRGLEIVESIKGPDRDRLECELQLQLSFGLTASEGYGSARAVAAATRASELLESMNHPEIAMRVILDLFTFATIRGERPEAGKLIDRGRRLVNDPAAAAMFDSCDALLETAYGDLRKSRALFESALSTLEALPSQPDSVEPGSRTTDAISACLSQLGHLTWAMGDADSSDRFFARAIERAQQLDGTRSAFNEAYALAWMTVVALHEEDHALARTRVDRLVSLCAERGLAMWGAFGSMYDTVLKSRQDPTAEAIATIEVTVEILAAMRVVSYQPYFLAEAAKLNQQLGDPERAVELLRQAIANAEANYENPEVAEIHRLLARARLDLAAASELALEDFLAAAEIAMEQGAVIYGVRALTDIVELFEPQDYPSAVVEDLRSLLSEVATPERYAECAQAERVLARTEA